MTSETVTQSQTCLQNCRIVTLPSDRPWSLTIYFLCFTLHKHPDPFAAIYSLFYSFVFVYCSWNCWMPGARFLPGNIFMLHRVHSESGSNSPTFLRDHFRFFSLGQECRCVKLKVHKKFKHRDKFIHQLSLGTDASLVLDPSSSLCLWRKMEILFYRDFCMVHWEHVNFIMQTDCYTMHGT